MKRLLAVLLLLCCGAVAQQTGHVMAGLDTVNLWAQAGQNNLPVGYTVAALPAAPEDGATAIVLDGNGASCTSGGGLTLVFCRYSAAAATWQVVGGGGGGGAVASVFGRTGVVIQQTGDYTVSQVTGAAPLASPAFTGTPTAPTQATSDNTTAIATDAYVKSNLASYLTFAYQTVAQGGVGLPSRPTLNLIAGTNVTLGCVDNSGALRTDCTINGSGSGAVSSVFGRVGAVVQQSGDYGVAQVTGAAPLASPTFTGTPTGPTPITSDNSTALATTAYVKSNLSLYLQQAYQTVQSNGTGVFQRSTINFIAGTNTTVACVDNGASLRTDCTFSSTGGGGAGSPGGTNSQLQFNNSAAFGGMTGSVVSGSNLALAGSLTLNPTAALTGGVLVVSPTDTTTPAAIFNSAAGTSADVADFNIGGVKQFFIDQFGQANFQAADATSASLLVPNFVAAPPNVQGSWYCNYPACQYFDGSSWQQFATNLQANTFQATQTFLAPSASSKAIIIKAASSPSADVWETQDSSANVQLKVDSSFNFWAPSFNTNGIRNGTFELSAQNSDPATDCTGTGGGTGKGCVDTQSFRFEVPNTVTSYRYLVPGAAPASSSFIVTDSCPADVNGTPKCTTSYVTGNNNGDLPVFSGTTGLWSVLAGNVTGAFQLQNSSGVLSWQPVSSGGTVTTTGTPAAGNLTKFSGATAITNGDLSGDVSTSGTLVTTIGANKVNSAKLAVVNTIRPCYFDNDTQSATALTNAQLTGRCMVPMAATVVEIDVFASGGTPSVMIEKVSGGVHTNLLAAALATAASGGIACDSTNATCYGGQAKTAGLSVTSLAAGDILDIASATAGGTATWMHVAIFYTVN